MQIRMIVGRIREQDEKEVALGLIEEYGITPIFEKDEHGPYQLVIVSVAEARQFASGTYVAFVHGMQRILEGRGRGE